MDLFLLTCNEIDEYDKTLCAKTKLISQNVLQEYKNLVEDDNQISFNQELAKFSRDEVEKLKQQHFDEVDDMNKKAKEFRSLIKSKERQNNEMLPTQEEQKRIYLIPKEKLKEVDINHIKNASQNKTHIKLLNYQIIKIQRAFRQYLENKRIRCNKRIHKDFGVTNNVQIIRSLNKKQDHKRFEPAAFNALEKGIEYIKRNKKQRSFDFILSYAKLRAKLQKRAINIIKQQSSGSRRFGVSIRNELESVAKVEGRYKMAEHFYMRYQKFKIFEGWCIQLFKNK